MAPSQPTTPSGLSSGVPQTCWLCSRVETILSLSIWRCLVLHSTPQEIHLPNPVPWPNAGARILEEDNRRPWWRRGLTDDGQVRRGCDKQSEGDDRRRSTSDTPERAGRASAD